MSSSEAAKRNHDQLFGDRVSTLARTDPELIEHFDNFAFDEALPTPQGRTRRSTCTPAYWSNSPPSWRSAASRSSG